MKNLLIVTALFSLAGCASTPNRPISQDAAASLKGKSVTVVERESPVFVAMTAGKGMFALAGVGAAAVSGNKLVTENQIEDPAKAIGQSVAETLHRQHGMVFRGASGGVASSSNLEEIVQLAQGSDFALDVATKGWSYIYDGFKFSDYFVGYSSELRLIDVNTGKVVSSGKCTYDAKKAGKAAVTRDVLLDNNAAYIKNELAEATDLCVQRFGTVVL